MRTDFLWKAWRSVILYKRRNKYIKVNNIYSVFKVLLSGYYYDTSRGSILAPIFLKIFINDLFYWVKNSELHNFADDNTVSAAEVSIENLLENLERES